MRIKRPLAPSFLNKLDASLLKKNPSVWSTRAHLVVYYSLLFIAFMVFIGFVVPSDPREESEVYVWVTLVSLISLLALVCWIIYLLRFNVFKRFGIQDRFEGLRTFLLYFFSVGMIVAAPFVPSLLDTIKANIAYKDQELVADVNKIHKNLLLLERDSIQLRWLRDTYTGTNKADGIVSETHRRVADTIAPSATDGQYYLIDTASLRSKLSAADSMIRINDSTYTIFETPDYMFIQNWKLSEYRSPAGEKFQQSVDLYRNYLEHFRPFDKDKALKELSSLIDKYQISKRSIPVFDFDAEEYLKKTYSERIRTKYDLHRVGNNIGNILSRMHAWDSRNLDVILRTFYYVTMAIVLLIFIFRYSTTKTFFLSLLFVTALSILTTIIMVSAMNSQDAVFVLMLIYYLAFAVVAFLIRSAVTRMAVHGIALNLFTFFTPFIPLLLVGWYYIRLRSYTYTYAPYNPDVFRNEGLHYLLAEVGGFLIFLILIEPVFKKLYRKWFALPEN